MLVYYAKCHFDAGGGARAAKTLHETLRSFELPRGNSAPEVTDEFGRNV